VVGVEEVNAHAAQATDSRLQRRTLREAVTGVTIGKPNVHACLEKGFSRESSIQLLGGCALVFE